MDRFSKQFTKNRTLLMKCGECSNNRMVIYSKNCSPVSNSNIKYNACIIWVQCNSCGAVDDFFINKDYYGYIDVNAKPLKGDWKV